MSGHTGQRLNTKSSCLIELGQSLADITYLTLPYRAQLYGLTIPHAGFA